MLLDHDLEEACIPKQEVQTWTTARFDVPVEIGSFHPYRAARDLYDDSGITALHAEKQRQSDKSFRAHNADLERLAVWRADDCRRDRRFEEVNVLDVVIELDEYLAKVELDRLEKRRKPLSLCCGQVGQ